MSARPVVLMIVGLLLGGAGCGTDHCGFVAGDATCMARDPNAPFCNLCQEDNKGCTATKPAESDCQLASDGSPPITTQPSTSPQTDPDPDPDPTTTDLTSVTTQTSQTSVSSEPLTSSSEASDGTTFLSDPATSTGPGDDTTSTSTTNGTTMVGDDTTSTSGETTDGSSSTTSDETTGPLPPMCGNDKVEGMEVCDGADLGTQDCGDFGFGGGAIACNPMCQYNPGPCCLSNNQQCNPNMPDCCPGLACKFDLIMAKNLCKP